MNSAVKRLARLLLGRELRNWLRAPTQSLRWIRDDIRFRLGSVSAIEMRPGWKLRSHPAAMEFAYSAQISDPEQVEEFDGFLSYAREGMSLFDIGAHFGLFSLAACHYGGPLGRAVAVDPSPVATRIMRIQAALNDVSERMLIVQATAAEDTGERFMVSTGVQGAGYYLPPVDHSGRELTATRAVTIDSLSTLTGLEPTHIKIDVEGGEQAVLAGGKRVLSALPGPVLFLELHNRMVREHGGDPRESLAAVRRYGYTVFSSTGEETGDEAVLERDLVRIVCLKRQ